VHHELTCLMNHSTVILIRTWSTDVVAIHQISVRFLLLFSIVWEINLSTCFTVTILLSFRSQCNHIETVWYHNLKTSQVPLIVFFCECLQEHTPTPNKNNRNLFEVPYPLNPISLDFGSTIRYALPHVIRRLRNFSVMWNRPKHTCFLFWRTQNLFQACRLSDSKVEIL